MLIAGKAVGTGVIIIAFVSGLAEYKMASNLFWDSCPVFAVFCKYLADLSEGRAFIEHSFNDRTFFDFKVFLISHVNTSLRTGTQHNHYNTRIGTGRIKRTKRLSG